MYIVELTDGDYSFYKKIECKFEDIKSNFTNTQWQIVAAYDCKKIEL